jgi:hypothetical protein
VPLPLPADDRDRTMVQPTPVPARPPTYPPSYPPSSPSPFGKRRSRLVPTLAAGGAIVVIAVIISALLRQSGDTGAGGTPSTRASVNAVVSTTTPAPPPGTSSDQPAPMGTPVSPAKGWTITVTGAELDADARMAASSFLSRPGAGKQFVLVSVAGTYQGDQPATPIGALKVSLLTPQGTAYGWALNPTPDRLDAFAQVPPGGSVTGSIAFEIPKADVARVALLAEPLFSLDAKKDQRYLAIR